MKILVDMTLSIGMPSIGKIYLGLGAIGLTSQIKDYCPMFRIKVN